MIHPIPPGTRDVLPDEMRELRAITDGLRDALRAAPATARCGRPRWSTRRCCAPATRARAGAGYRAVRRAGPGAGAALGHDDPDRAAGRHPLRRRRAAAAPVLLRATPTAPSSAAAASSASSSRAGIELIGVPGRRGRGRGDRADLDGARWTARACAATASAWATARCTARCSTRLEVPEDARAELLERLSRARPRGPGDAGRPARPGERRARALLVRLPELRGGPEVLERAPGRRGAGRPARRCTRAARGARAWPTG